MRTDELKWARSLDEALEQADERALPVYVDFFNPG